MDALLPFLTTTSFRLKNNRKLRFDYVVMILGLVISVTVVSTAINLFEGYQRSLTEIMLDSSSHILAFSDNEQYLTPVQLKPVLQTLENRPELKSARPVYSNAVMIKKGGKVRSGLVRAYSDSGFGTYWFEKYLQRGTQKLAGDDIIIGEKMARDMNARVGDLLTLIYADTKNVTPLGMIPHQADYRINAIIKTGYYEMDKSLIIMPEATAFRFYKTKPQYSHLEINLKDAASKPTLKTTQNLQHLLGNGIILQNWVDLNGNLFSLITMEKWLIFLVFSFLIMIASINCISTVSTSIFDRKKEIAILRTVGTPDHQIKTIVYLRILLVCSASIIVGLMAGLLTSWLITRQSLYQLKGDVYFIDRITMKISAFNYLIVFVTAFSAVSICTYLPLKHIKRLQIIDILRGN